MIKTILTLAFAGATGAAGYLGGSIYPAPPEVVDAINKGAIPGPKNGIVEVREQK